MRRGPAVSAVAVLILAATTIFSVWEWRAYRLQRDTVVTARRTLESINNVLSGLLDAEAAQRSFVLSGDEEVLDSYWRAVGQIPADLANFEQLGEDSRLRNLVDHRIAELAQGIEARRSQGAAAAATLAGEPSPTMAEIRHFWTTTRQREYDQLQDDPHAGEAGAHIALLVLVGASLILLFLLVLARPAALPATSPGFFGYALAVGAVAGATALRFALTPFLGPSAVPFITYFPAALLVSWRSGFRVGATTVALSAVAADVWFIPPIGALSAPHSAEMVTLTVFSAVGLGMAWLAHSQRQALRIAAAETALRREAEAEQASHRRQLQITIDSIGDAVMATDAQGRIVLANTVAQRLLRGGEAEILGRPIDDVFRIVNEDTRATVASPVAKVLREGVVTGLANHTILIAFDGAEVPIDDSAAPIRGPNGEIGGAVLVFRDIAERRRAERNTAFLQSLVASSGDAIVGKSLDGIVQTWNAGAERLYGYRAEEIVGRPAAELIPPDRAHEEEETLRRLRNTERISHWETVRLRKDGSTVDVALTISPVRNARGDVIGVSHVARDITEQKKTAERLRQSQKLESLGVLAGGIAHDFNNLLVGIIGNASLAHDELTSDAPARQRMRDILLAGERAAGLTRQMLAYSGKGRFVLKRINLSEEIRETLPLLQAAIPRTVALRLDLAADLPPVEVDVGQLHQILMNLVVNGAEAIPEGSPGTVDVATRRVRVDQADIERQVETAGGELRIGDYVLLEIRDSGSGMEEAVRGRIFDPFFTTKFTGRGLGLAAVLGIVRGHGGSIAVSSAPGRGSTFRVWLPARTGVVAPEPVADRPAVSLSGYGLVLVVDDEELVRNVARTALSRSGYTVLLAGNGAEGLEVFERNAADIRCVVLDLTMPVMSGEEALRRMRAVRAGVKVILSSGFSETEALRRFAGQGLAGFLQKPYQATALAAKVRATLGDVAGAAGS